MQWRPQCERSAGATVYWFKPLVGLVDEGRQRHCSGSPSTAPMVLAQCLIPREFVFMNTDDGACASNPDRRRL